MNITYLIRDDGACGYYRQTLPHVEMSKNGHTVRKIEKGDNADHIEKALDGCEVFVCARPNEEQIVNLLGDIKKSGSKIVIDYDDDLFSVSPMSAHYQDWGTENVTLDIAGKKVELWEDGKNIDLKANVNRLDCVRWACEAADVVSVTQPVLADVYGQYSETICLPNCIDTSRWQSLPLKREQEEVRLYWSGGSSHYEDWFMMSDAIRTIMEKYPKAKLVLLGQKFDGTLKGINPHQIEFHGWIPTPAYPYKTAILDADISLIPLMDTHFNRCKSSIKLVEQSALGVASVVSNVTPYAEFYNGGNGVFIDNNTTQGWVEGISYLIDNPLDRWKIGGAALTHVKNNFDIKTQYKLWQNAYEELL
jgi:glycosyltransferase involved in cell wall biosynthesis